MTQLTSRRIIASLVTAFFLLQPAAANPATTSPVGEWKFHSGKMRGGCTLAGYMNVTQKKDRTLACRFTARWKCEQAPMRHVDTEQSCIATQENADIVITSRMEKVTAVEPAELAAFMRENYAADHFKLRINARGDEMRGLFHSYGQAEVIFRRRIELVG